MNGRTESNLGKWGHGAEPHRYGQDDVTYLKAAQFLDSGDGVEDWGCGGRWAAQFFKSPYVGVDGSIGLADKIVDLVTYRTRVHGILLRHVLEHNYQWAQILENALASCDRLAVVIFTPFSDDVTKEIHFSERIQVPDISFKKEDLTRLFPKFEEETVETLSGYDDKETIFYVTIGGRGK